MSELTQAFFQCDALDQSGWTARREIRLPLDDLGFRQGVTAVERLRTYRGKTFMLSRHEVRFRQTLRSLKIDLEHIRWSDLNAELMARNSSWIAAQGDVGITWWATPGGLDSRRSPTFAIHLSTMDLPLQERHRKFGQDVLCTSIEQPSDRSWSRQAKTRCRVHYYLADKEAEIAGPHTMGLLLDVDGSITESSVANVAIVCDDQIIAPPPERILQGMTQMYVQTLARKLGMGWSHRRLFPQDLHQAERILLMGTEIGLWFARSVDGRPCKPPDRIEHMRRLQKAFLEEIECNPLTID